MSALANSKQTDDDVCEDAADVCAGFHRSRTKRSVPSSNMNSYDAAHHGTSRFHSVRANGCTSFGHLRKAVNQRGSPSALAPAK